MKWGVIKISGIFALVGINLSLLPYNDQSEKPLPTVTLEKGALGGQAAGFRLGHVDLPYPEKRKANSIQGTFLFSHDQSINEKGFSLEQAARIDTPLFYAHKNTKFFRPGKFSLELYQVAETPNTHFHIRAVDHNNIGYGGGLKIALEIVEKF